MPTQSHGGRYWRSTGVGIATRPCSTRVDQPRTRGAEGVRGQQPPSTAGAAGRDAVPPSSGFFDGDGGSREGDNAHRKVTPTGISLTREDPGDDAVEAMLV